jgi:hypothetical protein
VVVAIEKIDSISFIVGCVFIISKVGADLSVLVLWEHPKSYTIYLL